VGRGGWGVGWGGGGEVGGGRASGVIGAGVNEWCLWRCGHERVEGGGVGRAGGWFWGDPGVLGGGGRG